MDWAKAWKENARFWRGQYMLYRKAFEGLLDENENLRQRLAVRPPGTTTPLGAFYGSLVGPLDSPTEDLQRAFEITPDEP